MDLSTTYEVRLPVFEGPLDLLLHLIEREELDITAISLAQVTDQYLEYLYRLEQRNAANLADFLVVASKLILIKSRMLLPQPRRSDQEEEEEVGEDLVRQLLEYKKFKAVAAYLAEREVAGLRCFVRVVPAVVAGRLLDLEGVDVSDLVRRVREALEIVPPAPPVSVVIPRPIVSIDEKIGFIKEKLSNVEVIDFAELVRTTMERVEVIVTFLAVLELVKSNFLSVFQEELFGPILLRRKLNGEKIIEEASDEWMM